MFTQFTQNKKESKVISNRYNQAPRLTQDTDRKVRTSQLDITNESQEVSPFPTDDHKASTNRKHSINDPQKQKRLGTVSKNILLEGLYQFNDAPTSPLGQM